MAFFNSAITVLQTLVVALGSGLGIWGAINLLEGRWTSSGRPFSADRSVDRQRQSRCEVTGNEAADGRRRRCPDRHHTGSPAVRTVWLIC